MTVAAIRREKDLGDLLGNYKPAAPDEEKPVETVGENKFAALFYSIFSGVQLNKIEGIITSILTTYF